MSKYYNTPNRNRTCTTCVNSKSAY